MHHTQVLDRGEEWFARGRRAEVEPGQESRSVPDSTVMLSELGEVGVVVGFGECADALDRDRKRVAIDQREDGGAHLAVGCRLVEDDIPRIAQLQRCDIKIAKRAQPGFLRGRSRLREHRGGDRIEQIDDVVPGRGLERADEREQRCGAPVVRQSRDRLRLGGCGKARERCDLAGWQAINLRETRGERADLIEAGERAANLGAALDVRTVAQTIEWALPGAVGHGDKAVQALALLGCQSLDQAAMEVRRGDCGRRGAR